MVRDSPSQNQSVRVAICQIEVTGYVADNLQTISDSIAIAASHGADGACFPEASLFGWTNSAAHSGAASIPGLWTDWIGQVAREKQIAVVIGLAERDESDLYNSVVFIDRDGEIKLKHRKVNVLQELMSPPYSQGASAVHSVAETSNGRVGRNMRKACTFGSAIQPRDVRRPSLE